MKNKKGFTITEILLVIVTIGIILSVAIPTAILISKSIKERAYDSKMNSILRAAELYGKNNKDAFGEADTIQISVETLLATGYLDEDETCERAFGCVLDPRDNSIMNDDAITIKLKSSVIQAFKGPMEIEVAINFDANGATNISAEGVGCKTLNGSTCTVTIPTITREGHTIIGWGKSPSSTTSTYDVSSNIEIGANDNNVTYYAITSKNIVATFDKNTAASISATSLNCNMYNTQTSCLITLPSITPNSGYSVIGWNTNLSATTKQYDASQSLAISSNVTYYAITKLITYTCSKVNTSTTCSYTSESSAITACQTDGNTNCSAVGCESDLWTYNYTFSLVNNGTLYTNCVVQGRTSQNMSRLCTVSNIKELLISGNDGIQDLDYNSCNGVTLYWSGGDEDDIRLSESTNVGTGRCEAWARSESGYTKWDYTGTKYLYNQTSCPEGYTSTLE